PENPAPAPKTHHRARNLLVSALCPFRVGFERRKGSERKPRASTARDPISIEGRKACQTTPFSQGMLFNMPSSTMLECDGRAASAAPQTLARHVFGSKFTENGGEDLEEESRRLGKRCGEVV
ncbi:hypothetical protein EV715DRAFT_215135, partial [Schizophyllum commune]